MRLAFAILRYYPLIAIPLAGVLAELAYFMKRKGSSLQYVYWGISILLVVTSVLWGVYRGDIHSDQWLKDLTGWKVTQD